ncbi:MAG: hypothetical protein ABR512_12510 [Desulfopila sp.]
MRYLHISRNIERYLERLRTGGKHGVLAASQYLQIIEYIRQAKWRSDAIHCKRTKNGEYRLRNCIKYDLGHGYRLVTVKDGDNLFITFAGNHDQTDRWIETHRYDKFCEDDSLYISEMIAEEEHVTSEQSSESLPFGSQPEPGEYEEQLLGKIDDEVLKMVFPGLYR